MGFFDIVNLWGLLFAAVLAAPHIVFVKTRSYDKSVFDNRAMLYIARIGRFFSLFLMSFHIGVLDRGFTEPKALMERFWLISVAILLAAYGLFWLLFYRTQRKGAALGAILCAAAVVMLSGILQVNTLLLTAGIVYLIGDLYLFSRYFQSR